MSLIYIVYTWHTLAICSWFVVANLLKSDSYHKTIGCMSIHAALLPNICVGYSYNKVSCLW